MSHRDASYSLPRMDAEQWMETGADYVSLSPVDGEEAVWIRRPDGWCLYERHEPDPTTGPYTAEELEGWLASWLLARSEHGDVE